MTRVAEFLVCASVLIGTLSGAVGCARVSHWTKSGISDEDRRRDETACDETARRAQGMGAARLAYEECMRGKGYEFK